MKLLQRLWRSHQELPRFVRVQWVAPLTLALAIVGGGFFELPPGPLCDEGMVLFMEGGCDYGVSNIFFFSKLGLLVALNVAFVVAWFGSIRGFLGFVPHFSVALWLAVLNWSGGRCDSYYSNPNGSVGQMILEVAAFAVLGIAVLMRWQRGGARPLVLTLLGWNFVHVSYFYLGLALFPHWTWLHTALVTLSLIATAGLVTPDRLLKHGRLLERGRDA